MVTVSIDNTSFSFADEVGERMPNSAIIVAEKVSEHPDWAQASSGTQRVSVVLALCLSRITPYATWLRVVRFEDSYKSGAISANPVLRDFCETGHYHRTIEEAVREFQVRSAREMGDHITSGPDRCKK